VREALPLLAAIVAAAAILVAGALASGPPAQDQFPYPADGPGVMSPPMIGPPGGVCEGEGLNTPRLSDPPHPLLPFATGAFADAVPVSLMRNRMFLVKNAAQASHWRSLVGFTPKWLPELNFKECALLAVVVPHASGTFLGARLNDPTTLTAGVVLAKNEHCGVSTRPNRARCHDGWAILVGLPAKSVRSVEKVYAITQPPPPPSCWATRECTTG
jgi:hypothetical protein